jgi:hypothetical protein
VAADGQLSPLSLLYALGALRLLQSVLLWREALPDAVLQRLALVSVTAHALGPLLRFCLQGQAAVAVSAPSQDAPSTAKQPVSLSLRGGAGASSRPGLGATAQRSSDAVFSASSTTGVGSTDAAAAGAAASVSHLHVAGSLLATLCDLLPPEWLRMHAPAAAAAGGAHGGGMQHGSHPTAALHPRNADVAPSAEADAIPWAQAQLRGWVADALQSASRGAAAGEAQRAWFPSLQRAAAAAGWSV